MFHKKSQIKFSNLFKNVFRIHFCSSSNKEISSKMRVLNVAEKNDAAKNIAGHLSGGNLQRVILILNLFNNYVAIMFLIYFREKVFQNLIKYMSLTILFKDHLA